MIIRKIVFISLLMITFGLPINSLAVDCFESSIVSPTPFMGNNDEIFKLADGSIWQVKYEYEYLYEYNPKVVICPSRGKLIINENSLNVEPLSRSRNTKSKPEGGWELYEKTNIVGKVNGTIQQGNIFKTTSGSIYEVTGRTLQVVLELQPEVMVLRNGDVYKLVVEGFGEPLICRKLK